MRRAQRVLRKSSAESQGSGPHAGPPGGKQMCFGSKTFWQSGRYRIRTCDFVRVNPVPKTSKTLQTTTFSSVLVYSLTVRGATSVAWNHFDLWMFHNQLGKNCGTRNLEPSRWWVAPRSLGWFGASKPFCADGSRLSQHQVHDPAAADVRLLRIAAVVEDLLVVAPGVLQGVGQNRHRGEVARVVDALRYRHDRGGEPRRIGGH